MEDGEALQDELAGLDSEFEQGLKSAADLSRLQELEDRFLGRKSGRLTALMKRLGTLPAEARRTAGQRLNALKGEFEGKLERLRAKLHDTREAAQLEAERIDITLPGRRPPLGRRHPLTVVREELEDIFVAMGYEVYDGPEVEDDYHCFEALNMPPDHPARDMQDTFYLDGGKLLLRTHTSSAQIHYMLENAHPPDVRIICPGKVYRRDSDITHSPMFNQIEGLVVGPGITLGHLKGTIEAFLKALFGQQYPVRFRPSYFPYTEPSVEADLGCIVCGGSGKLGSGDPCRVCKTTGWLEILGSGLVDPAVFEAVNARLGRAVYDPAKVSGFAFGLGIERVAMVRHGVGDIRAFFENDLRFLEQFPGMKFPLSWLKEYVDLTVEPERLGDDLTAVGLAVEGIERDGKDVVLDFDITTNRVDCMNVYGLAREAALVYGLPLRPLAVDVVETGPAAAEALGVEIAANDLCPRFCARVLDVRVGESPQWLKDRLEQVGVRPISNVVDLTNYVLMEMGQPTHAFDLERIPEQQLVVRWAREGESVVTLDGQERALTPRIGVVAGRTAALGLAGIMGGRSSEVQEQTRVVALEAAYWEPLAIRRAAKALGMHTDASHRFERGADYGAAAQATNRIAHLLGKIGAGRARPGVIDVVGRAQARRRLVLRPERVDQLLGTRVPAGECERILKGLGFEVAPATAEQLVVVVPAWRGDVTREVDLVEEVGRHRGLDSIPNTLPPATAPGMLAPHQRLERVVRRTLADLGLDEAVNYAFVPQTDWTALMPDEQPVRVLNPISADHAVLRSSLIPGLVRNLQTNLRHGRADVALFEIGRVFQPSGDAAGKPVEAARLALLLAGAWARRGFADQRPGEFADLQGVLEALGQRLGQGALDLTAQKTLPWSAWVDAYLHPQRWAHPTLGGRSLGLLAELHPRQVETLGLKGRVLVAEIDLGLLGTLVGQQPRVRTRPLPRFPSVERDLAVLWPAGRHSAELVAAAGRTAGVCLSQARIVDRYEHKSLAGRVSLTLRLRFASPERTLTADEVDAAVAAVVDGLPALGAEVRGV